MYLFFIKFFQTCILIFLFKINIVAGIPKKIDKIAAIVNHHVILESDIVNKINIINQDILPNSKQKIIENKKTYIEILNKLISEQLILQFAAQENMNINPNQLNQMINCIAHERNMTTNQFNIYLNKIGLNYNKYCLELHQEILKKIVFDHITRQKLCVLTTHMQDVTQILQPIDFNKQFKLIHIIIELPTLASLEQIEKSEYLGKLLTKQIKTNQNIQKLTNTYYNNSIFPRIMIQETEWVTWKNVPIIFDQYIQDIKPNDVIGPIRSYNGIHILIIKDIQFKQCTFPVIKIKMQGIISTDNSINKNIKNKILHIKKRIENNDTTFTLLMKETPIKLHFKNHPYSSEWIDLDYFDPSIQKSLLSLKKQEISMPIYTSNGWCLIQLIDINKLSYSEIMQERAYYYLLCQTFDTNINNWIQELRSESYIKIIH